MTAPLHFTAAVSQVRTLADGGIRITLDLPESDIATATAMMQAKQQGAVIEVAWYAVQPVPKKEAVDYGL